MSEHKLEFMFNTPITGVSEGDGAFDATEHKRLVLPIRGRIMQIDGVSGCFIARFGFYVEYFDEMTQLTTVVDAVSAIIHEFGQKPVESGLFPLRGSKEPEALLEVPKRMEYRYRRVSATIDSLLEYHSNEKGEFDQALFNTAVRDLVDQLGASNGVLRVAVTMTIVEVDFDSKVTSCRAVEAHITDVLLQLRATRRPGFFPYVDENDDLKMVFTYWNLPEKPGS